MTTKKTQALAILSRHAGAWVTAQQLIDAGAGYRYGARLAELRERGHDIETKRIRGQWCYRLLPPGQLRWEAA